MGLTALLVAAAFAAPQGVDLIADPRFDRGFEVYDPTPGAKVLRGVQQWDNTLGGPVWGLAQWSSRYSLAGAPLEEAAPGVVRFFDAAKSVTVGPRGDAGPDLALAIDSRREWGDTPRKKGQLWPHLLVSQRFPEDTPFLPDLKALHFSVDARLARAERFDREGYDPHIHAAQFLIFFTVQNLNRDSAGYGDFLWLGVSVYDDRGRPDLSIIGGDQDLGKLIYTPARAAYTDGDITSGDWTTYAADLLPLAKAALAAAWERGFLKDSQDLADYRLGGMNLGWEVTGINDVAMEVRRLSLRAETRPSTGRGDAR